MNLTAFGKWAILFLSAGLLVSCGTSARRPDPPGPPFTYTIRVDGNSLDKANVQVHVLKLNSSTRHQIESVALTDYFGEKSDVRDSAPVIRKFVMTGGGPAERIDLNAPEFKDIRHPNYSYIAILAYPPFPMQVKDGRDPRRLLLPLDPKKWGRKQRDITITITRALGVIADPGPMDSGQ